MSAFFALAAAPSSRNGKPWAYCHRKDGRAIAVASAPPIQNAGRSNRRRSGVSTQADGQAEHPEQHRIFDLERQARPQAGQNQRAPVILAACLDQQIGERGPGQRIEGRCVQRGDQPHQHRRDRACEPGQPRCEPVAAEQASEAHPPATPARPPPARSRAVPPRRRGQAGRGTPQSAARRAADRHIRKRDAARETMK